MAMMTHPEMKAGKHLTFMGIEMPHFPRVMKGKSSYDIYVNEPRLSYNSTL